MTENPPYTPLEPEKPDDLLTQLTGGERKKEREAMQAVYGILSQLTELEVAKQLTAIHKEQEGLDEVTARRTGMQAGETTYQSIPLPIFALPIDEEETRHLIVAFDGENPTGYKVIKLSAINQKSMEKMYKKFMRRFQLADQQVTRLQQSHNINLQDPKTFLNYLEIILSFVTNTKIEYLSPQNEEEFLELIEQAAETARQVHEKKRASERRVLEKMRDTFSRLLQDLTNNNDDQENSASTADDND